MQVPINLKELLTLWQAHWESALRCWSPYIQLSEPTWCFTPEEEAREELTGSFAMIRLLDHRVVISLRQIAEKKLEAFATEILAHEIGHHVYCPADLTDNARVLVRLRAGLPTKENLAPFIANLYEDLLINDRLQRSARLRMADVYAALHVTTADPLWLLYMRTYELLWQLPRASLAVGAEIDARLETDAQLAARLIRSYSKDWIAGAGRFAALCLPYLMKDEAKDAQKSHQPWNDTKDAGKGGMPDGLTEIEAGENDVMHPAEDPDLSGLPASAEPSNGGESAGLPTATGPTGRKVMKNYRDPFEYAQVLRAAGGNIAEELMTAHYYRERALPHLIRFPQRESPLASDPSPEGLDTWDIGSPLESVDWMGTLLVSPTVIPGMTTRERLYGDSPGTAVERIPVDLYLGVDCSGSMGNPSRQMSYPVLAGAIMALSALRAGARVMVALSGEPGRTITTTGFVRDESLVLKTLTDYLGTGTTFGIHRLADTFAAGNLSRRPIHILIITDNDIFSMLDRSAAGAKVFCAPAPGPADQTGWDVARTAAENARGGAIYVLQLPRYLLNQASAQKVISPGEQRMLHDGWNVAHVDSEEEMLAFARKFSQLRYGAKPSRKPHAQ